MTTIQIHHKDNRSIDEIVDYIFEMYPSLPDSVTQFSITGGSGTIAGARSKKSLRIEITYLQENIDRKTMEEIEKLLKYLKTLSAEGIEIEVDK